MNPVALVRAAYGTVLLLAPARVLQLYGGPPDDSEAKAVARVLGARHILQAIMTKGGKFSRLGAVVDGVHAATMFALAAASAEYGRPALIDGSVAATFSLMWSPRSANAGQDMERWVD